MNTTTCFRCHKPMPDPDIIESISREQDWRDWLEEHPEEALNDEERVLICIDCADELAELEEKKPWE